MVKWSTIKTFVTGGNGFLGSWLVKRLLHEGADVTCLIRDDLPKSLFSRERLDTAIRIVPGELEDTGLLERTVAEGNFDVVFHLAAQAIVSTANKDPVPTFRSNILGTWNILEACRKAKDLKGVVIASSDKAYGANTVLPYQENYPLQGRHPYDVSKSCADLLAQAYHASYFLPVSVIRSGNLIGGGDPHASRLVPGTIISILKGERPVIRSDGRYKRDYVYVEDAVDAYLRVAEAEVSGSFAGRAWNVSLEAPATVLDVVDRLRSLLHREDLMPIIEGKVSNEIREQYLDSKQIRSELGWAPAHTLDGALQKTVEWYVNNL